MDTLTERLEQLAELQKKNIEPLQNIGGTAFSTFESMARKNYELMGDMVDYAVAQSRGSIEQTSPQALYERQMSEARAFAERMSERAAEYMALAEQMRGEMTADVERPGMSSGAADKAPAADTNATTKTVAATPTARKAPVRKSTASKGIARKVTTKKAAAKKGTASKVPIKKTSATKATARKTAASKTNAKKATRSGTAAAKKATAKKPAAKRAATKKAATRKRAASKSSGGT